MKLQLFHTGLKHLVKPAHVRRVFLIASDLVAGRCPRPLFIMRP